MDDQDVALPKASSLLAGSRIIYTVNVDWFFLSHRLPLAIAAARAGAEVTVLAGDTGLGHEIDDRGLTFKALRLSRSAIAPLGETKSLLAIRREYRNLRPDLVHHVSLKPILYGSAAVATMKPSRRPVVINALSGLGFAFSEAGGRLTRLVEHATRRALRAGTSATIFQNPDDLRDFVDRGLVSARRAHLIRGSGVDLRQFGYSPVPAGPPIVMFASRMLLDKGVDTVAAAAPAIARAVPGVRIALVGGSDRGNPRSLTTHELQALDGEGSLEWWGKCSDMPAALRQAAVVVLPTRYPEGVPKVLLEAAAIGRPMVATDVPGCREIVRPGLTGTLVQKDDPAALALAVVDLLADRAKLDAYGTAARRVAESEFSESHVVAKTLRLYERLLNG